MKKTTRISTPTLSSRLAAYSATAGAVLAVSPAQAAIQNITSFTYNSTTTTTPPNYAPPYNSGVVQSFAFNAGVLHATFHAFRGSFNGFWLNASAAKDIAGGLSFILDLGKGQAIAGNAFGRSAFFASGVTSSGVGHFLPPPNGVKTGYFGFRTHQNGKTYYGWMNVKVTNSNGDNPVSITFAPVAAHPGVYGAYGLTSDDITAGELAATPEPGTLAVGGLGLLALGARGIRELRRRRETAAKN